MAANWLPQLLRFAMVGVSSNAALYLVFLGLLQMGAPYLPAMSLTYGTGVALGFLANRHWTFGQHGSDVARTLRRYLVAYALGYLLNLMLLAWLTGALQWPAGWVQGALVPVIAAILFLLQKFWVFAGAPPELRR